ncbi:hypothetical protein [Pseudogracilibacillus sp. SO30301A]|uniref:hypothetical protein n=1 Tax=Pseudogracilibacillus sp. SO30301A TaxID=3098291 RepID=UPI00300DECDB
MKMWKQAFWLAKFEWKVSAVNIFLCWLILTMVSLLFLTSFSRYIRENYIVFDIFFILAFSIAPSWLRSKHFQYQKVSEQIWASPTLIMQSQLPIPKDSVVKSRLIIYLAYLLPFIITVFPILYFFHSGIREIMSLTAYFVFFILWLSIGLSFGMIMPASDVGDYVSPKIISFYMIVTGLIGFGVSLFFYNFLGYGIVAWTIKLAQTQCLPTIIVAIILIWISWKFWPYYMKKRMQKLDYM